MDWSATNLTYYYSAGASATYFYRIGSDSTHHLALVYCIGIETSLLNCNYSTDFADLQICDYPFAADASVICQRGTEIDSIMEYSK